MKEENQTINYLNETFGKGMNSEFNACVGKNGFNSVSSYIVGFEMAVTSLYEDILSDSTMIDNLIYPLIFCARHRIELTLKTSLENIARLRENIVIDKKIKGSHCLGKILKELKLQSGRCDYRISKIINKISEYIDDYDEIDKTGQVFRYFFSNENEMHLKNLTLINARRFYKRYSELTNMFEELDKLFYNLVEEYSTHTFTKKFSRYEIGLIAKELPPYNHWHEDMDNEFKKKIVDKFGIPSKKKLSEILNIIKKNRQFASHIGIEIPVETLSLACFDYFIKGFLCYHFNDERKKEYSLANCDVSELATIYTLCRYSEDFSYCEHFENEVKETKKQIDRHEILDYFLSRKLSFIMRNLKRSLIILSLNTYLVVFEKVLAEFGLSKDRYEKMGVEELAELEE